MMRQAGHYTTAKKVDRIYEKHADRYKFFVRLDVTDFMRSKPPSTRTSRKPEGRMRRGWKSALSVPPLPSQSCTTAETAASAASSEGTIGGTASGPSRNSVRNAGRTAYILRTATRYRETSQWSGTTLQLPGPILRQNKLYSATSPFRPARETHITSPGYRLKNLPHQRRDSPPCPASPNPTHQDGRGDTSDGTSTTIFGQVTLPIRVHGRRIRHAFRILPTLESAMLIGTDQWARLRLT